MGFFGFLGNVAKKGLSIGQRLALGGGGGPGGGFMPGGVPGGFPGASSGAPPFGGPGAGPGFGTSMLASDRTGFLPPASSSAGQPWWKQAVGWAGKNPELATGLVGIGASLYGAHKAGEAEDQQLAYQRQQGQQSYELEKGGLDLRTRELQAKLDADAAEKARRQRALIDILGMGRTPVATTPAASPAAGAPPPAGG